MPPTQDRAQAIVALGLANAKRLGGAEVKADLRVGVITLADALQDPRAQSVPIGPLLCAQRRWGPLKTNQLLGGLHIFPTRRVRDLTDRQKTEIVRRATR